MPTTAVPAPEVIAASGLLRLSCVRSGAGVRVTATGELDIATVPQLDHALRRAQADADVVVLDLRGVRFMGCGGVELLLATHGRLGRTGGRLVVVRGPSEVDRLFTLVGIDGRLEFVDDPPAEAAA